MNIIDLIAKKFKAIGIPKPRGEIRRWVEQGAVRVNGEKVMDWKQDVGDSSPAISVGNTWFGGSV